MKAAIVPALNEAQTIGKVIETLVKAECFDEIIVVSDGSTDRTAVIAHDLGVKVIEHPKPRGKAGAMISGVKATKADAIFFCDADLRGLRVAHLQKLVKAFDSHDFGMVVALRDRGWFLTSISHFLPLISGERLLKRKIFEQTPAACKQGYQIELGLNATARHLGFGIGTVVFKGVSIRKKFQKVGMWRGTYQYVRMIGQLCRAFFSIHFLLWRR